MKTGRVQSEFRRSLLLIIAENFTSLFLLLSNKFQARDLVSADKT